MKKLLLALTCLSTMFSQAQFTCGTQYQLIQQPSYYNRSLSNPVDMETKYVFNVFIHFVLQSGDINPSPNQITYGEQQAMEAIKILNKNYNPIDIFFKYKGYETISSNSISNAGSVDQVQHYDAINLYYIENPLGYSGYSPQGSTVSFLSYAGIESSYKEQLIVHEIGHCFNLLHIFEGWDSATCEHVTRNSTAANYNAANSGDWVEDTPAQSLDGFIFNDCVSVANPNHVDCEGTPYENVIPHNWMGYDAGNSCPYHFTQGQIEKMRDYVANPPNHVVWDLVRNTVASLYEPFEEMDLGGDYIVELTDNGDGTAKVCRNVVRRHRFQTGFDYEFSSYQGNVFKTNTVDELPVIFADLYFGIKINQIDPNTIVGLNVRCPRGGQVCDTEPYIGGTIITTQFLNTMNLTIRDLTQIQARDPQLLEALLERYYNIIRRQTSSGAVIETIIYKN